MTSIVDCYKLKHSCLRDKLVAKASYLGRNVAMLFIYLSNPLQ